MSSAVDKRQVTLDILQRCLITDSLMLARIGAQMEFLKLRDDRGVWLLRLDEEKAYPKALALKKVLDSGELAPRHFLPLLRVSSPGFMPVEGWRQIVRGASAGLADTYDVKSQVVLSVSFNATATRPEEASFAICSVQPTSKAKIAEVIAQTKNISPSATCVSVGPEQTEFVAAMRKGLRENLQARTGVPVSEEMIDKLLDEWTPERDCMTDEYVETWVEQFLDSEQCSVCSKKPPKNERFRRCGGCHLMAYCGALCQKRDWKGGHKAYCKAMLALGRIVRAERDGVKAIPRNLHSSSASHSPSADD